MIPWQSLLANSLWIVGLAVLLARFSYSRAYQQIKRSTTEATRRFDWPVMLGLTLFCVGMLLTAKSQSEQAAWVVLLAASLVMPWWEYRRKG